MKYFKKYLSSLIFLLIIFTACKKEKNIELEPEILFSVDPDQQKFNYISSPSAKKYLAAYTTDGELIDYGCLSDSARWELSGVCEDNFIDIVYFNVITGLSNVTYDLIVEHFRNVSPGCKFADPYNSSDPTYYGIDIFLKVEDFGNCIDDEMYTGPYELRPHLLLRGYTNYNGAFNWDLIENGYAYEHVNKYYHASEFGMELVIFERGTNQPYVVYIEHPMSYFNIGDTIVLDKSDFKPAEYKTLQITNAADIGWTMLATYNSKKNVEDLLTNMQNEKGNIIYYVSTDILPTSHWEFSFLNGNYQKTSYKRFTSVDIPSSLEIKDLTGAEFWRFEDQYYLTHAQTFDGKNPARSALSLFKLKSEDACLEYNMHFSGTESAGDILIEPLEIPEEILINNIGLTELENLDWTYINYVQIYTDIPDNSHLDYLRNMLQGLKANDSSSSEYIYEEFSVNLKK